MPTTPALANAPATTAARRPPLRQLQAPHGCKTQEFHMSVDVTRTDHAPPGSNTRSADAARQLRACRGEHRTSRTRIRTAMAIIKGSPDGQCRVELPYWLVSASWWQFGRRMWMSIRPPGLHITPIPSGPRGEKRWSRRLQRVSLTLARRTSSSRMPCGQKLSDRHANRCIGTPKQSESASRSEVA